MRFFSLKTEGFSLENASSDMQYFENCKQFIEDTKEHSMHQLLSIRVFNELLTVFKVLHITTRVLQTKAFSLQ